MASMVVTKLNEHPLRLGLQAGGGVGVVMGWGCVGGFPRLWYDMGWARGREFSGFAGRPPPSIPPLQWVAPASPAQPQPVHSLPPSPGVGPGLGNALDLGMPWGGPWGREFSGIGVPGVSQG